MTQIDKAIEIVTSGVIGSFGGSAYYFYMVSKGQKFHISMFLINLFLAFFIGYVIGQFLPGDSAYRDGIISLSGFSSFPILSLIEKRGSFFFEKIVLDKDIEGQPK